MNEQEPTNLQAVGRVMTQMALENADLKITIETLKEKIKELEIESEKVKKEKE